MQEVTHKDKKKRRAVEYFIFITANLKQVIEVMQAFHYNLLKSQRLNSHARAYVLG